MPRITRIPGRAHARARARAPSSKAGHKYRPATIPLADFSHYHFNFRACQSHDVAAAADENTNQKPITRRAARSAFPPTCRLSPTCAQYRSRSGAAALLFAGQIIARAPIGLASHCEPVLAGYRVYLPVRKLSRARVLDLT